MLPQLRKLEYRFERELVVIGVHSGKFHAERWTENIRQAILRLEVDHPVVNDRQFRVWRSYAVDAWPTVALIDPDGRHIGSVAGEFVAEAMAVTIEALIRDFDARGQLVRSKLDVRPERVAMPERPLAFPGKVLSTEDGRLFISDSNHNRVLVVRLSEDGSRGTLEAVIGGGGAGFADGDFRSAAFYHPQGLALVGDRLYVADTENHAVRVVDLADRRVTTVAGTGEQARRRMTGGPGKRVDLNSPWDVVFLGGSLYVAMAGSHQIWRLDLATEEIHAHAGTGYEALIDGPLSSAMLAQPSGLTTDGRYIFFADSESSAIRRAGPSAPGTVETIVGTGLFDFGDVDGTGDLVRLQHPLGVVWHDGRLYVADTYNNKVKVVDPATRASTTYLGSGEAGEQDGSIAKFDEPGGISASGGKLYVADTNNHQVRVADVATREVSTLLLEGIR